MYRMVPAALVLALLRPGLSEAAKAGPRPAVPYGDYCMPGYGARHGNVRLVNAMKHLRAYYKQRGLEVGMLSHRGAFIRADVYRDGRKVDGIVYDIRTGKIRSVY